MMVEKKELPNGVIPFHDIPDMRVRNAVMKLNENIVILKRRYELLAAAVRELQNRR